MFDTLLPALVSDIPKNSQPYRRSTSCAVLKSPCVTARNVIKSFVCQSLPNFKFLAKLECKSVNPVLVTGFKQSQLGYRFWKLVLSYPTDLMSQLAVAQLETNRPCVLARLLQVPTVKGIAAALHPA
jgi:hypothetical protein